jgi:hypothetical protein
MNRRKLDSPFPQVGAFSSLFARRLSRVLLNLI